MASTYDLISQEKSVFTTTMLALHETKPPLHNASWDSVRNAAWERFKQLPMPNRKHEAWKYTPLHTLSSQSFEPSAPVNQLSPAQEALLATLPVEPSHCVVFIDGHCVSDLSHLQNLTGLQVRSFKNLLQQDVLCVQDLIRRHELIEDSNPFVALNMANFQDGLLIEAQAGQEIKAPLSLVFFQSNASGTLSLPIIIARAQNNAALALQSYFMSENAASQLEAPLYLLYADKEATLHHDAIYDHAETTTSLVSTHVFQAEASQYEQSSVTLAGQLVRQSTHVHLLAEKTETRLQGLAVLSGHTTAQDHIELNHNIPNCNSAQFYKGIMSGQSTYDFDGTIRIPKHAVQTNAEQLNQNLLLSDDARVYARPQLRIDADDVKCSHGATIGQLNETEIFYLKSRGIPETSARAMLTLGFADVILSNIQDESLRNWLLERVHERLEAMMREDNTENN